MTTRQTTVKLSATWRQLNGIRPFAFLLAIQFCVCLQPSHELMAEEFQLSLTGGSVITVDIAKESFPWTKVQDDGTMTNERINYALVQQIVISDSPASRQVAAIRKMLNQLTSQDYLKREAAEEKLSLPDFGGKFKTMIRSQAKHESYEVRYRIERILTKLDSDEDFDAAVSEFDILTLKDGTKIEGDAGDLEIKCVYREREMSFFRSDVSMISVPVKIVSAPVNAENVQVKTFNKPKNEFYQNNQTVVDFELSPSGAEIRRHANVNDLFSPVGLKFATEQDGYIGSSGYGFKFADKPPRGNSVCVFETIGTYNKRFKGVMVIEFCMPNQSSVPAGVNEIGLYMARVNHSRDFIVEAYNANGQLLAAAESSDDPCVFSGIKSTEPITKIRVLSNPYLFRIDRAIDEDFAVDNICFSKPVPVETSANEEKPVVRLKNGDLIRGDSIEIVDASTVSIQVPTNDPINIGFDEIQAINFAREPVANSDKKSWTAMLPDRSTILVEPNSNFTSKTFPDLRFAPTDLMGIWASMNAARFPEATDFDKAKTVFVFPTCRIVTNDVKFSDAGFTWPEDATKIQQPVEVEETEKEEKDEEEDPTPAISGIEYEKAWPESIPTVWFQPPKAQAANTGHLRLTDGQLLVFGANSSFSLVGLDQNQVTVSYGGNETKIPLEKIISVTFPGK